jgi:ADP-ribosylglycohydrolase
LEGLSVGDAFGDRYFGPGAEVMTKIVLRELPPAPWLWTDDTHMALSITEMLLADDGIDRDRLAQRFADRYEGPRKYGAGAFQLLTAIREGAKWRSAATGLFGGMGSFGNGAAMRSAPLGAYFADDLSRVVDEATAASEVTHAHPEGIAGGVAVAIAAAHACRTRTLSPAIFDAVLEPLSPGYTREAIEQAKALPSSTSLVDAAVALGNGSGVTAPDTVPLCLWILAHHTRTYQDAMWLTVSALGDRDTTCSIVGGVAACALGIQGIPAEWCAARELLQFV